jgi:hypothetical protein
MPEMTMTPSKMPIFRLVSTDVDQTFFTSSSTLPIYTAFYFSLSGNVPDYTSYTSVFDQFRLRRAQMWIVPRVGPSQISTSANLGQLASCVDYDDATSPTSIAQVSGYSNALVGPGTQAHYRDLKPHPAVAAYQGALTAFANVSPDIWIDSAYPNTQFFGVKTAITVTDAAYIFDVLVRTTWEFRNSR